MASFLPLIVSKKNEQTEKNMLFIAVRVSQIHINTEKNTNKTPKLLCLMYL